MTSDISLNDSILHINTAQAQVYKLPNLALIVWTAAVHSLTEGDQRIKAPAVLARTTERSLAEIMSGLRHLEAYGLIVRDVANDLLIPAYIAFMGPATATFPSADSREVKS